MSDRHIEPVDASVQRIHETRELPRSRWRASSDTQLFVFDAWAHQGDPLRRAFLESLAAFLRASAPGWLANDVWSDRLDFLTGRKAKTETTSEKRLTWWGTAVGIALISGDFLDDAGV